MNSIPFKGLVIILSFIPLFSGAQSPGYYFPAEEIRSMDESVPMPSDVLGFRIGQWHISHDQIIRYSEALAESSPRVEWVEYAHSHEQRPLFVLRITSPENQERIEKLRQNHLASSRGDALPHRDTPDPIVLYQGNSIHGDESSGANAAMLYAWYLASSKSKKVSEALENTVILLDPCFNPDGLQRFSNWVNANTSAYQRTADPADREFDEPWPGGRTNHYWFDLNRDWLLVQHPESRGRIRLFNRWLPHILTDHHEMGSDATYFFQPGIPSRTNPITLEQNQQLTGQIAEFHSAYLDELGSLYYTEESFDDFYYGKGSTYPDVRGSIGILFEQASSRGHRRETRNGLLSFPFTIRNQLATLRSTLEAGLVLDEELRQYQKEFFSRQEEASAASTVKAYLVKQCADPVRWNSFLSLLEQHNIIPRKLERDLRQNDLVFRKDKDIILPMNADHFYLKKTLFETPTSFPDSLFYDVSTWTLPLAYHLEYAPWTGESIGKLTGDPASPGAYHSIEPFVRSNYGYIISWDHFNAAPALGRILQEGYRASVATQTFRVEMVNGSLDARRGAIFIPSVQKGADQLHRLLQHLHLTYELPIHAVQSGLTPVGIDLGSPSMEALHFPKTLLLIGSGIRSYNAGEIWHLFDTRLDLPITKTTTEDLHRIDISSYRRIIIPHLYRHRMNDKAKEELIEWVREGGVLISERGANNWLESIGLADLSKGNSHEAEEEESTDQTSSFEPYSHLRRQRGSQRIGGAIFQAEMDTTHPLTYGYSREEIALFQRGTQSIGTSDNPYSQPLIYSDQPLMSGYAPDEAVKDLAGTAAVRIFRCGKGRIICFANNTHFRAYFRGSERLFINAIYFGHILDRGSAESVQGN